MNMTNRNGTGVCNWADWKDLTQDQKEYEQWRVIDMLTKKMSNIERTVKIYAFGGGFVGGTITVLGVIGAKFTFGL